MICFTFSSTEAIDYEISFRAERNLP